MSSIVSIFFVLFLWWFLTGIILYTAKRLDLGDSKTRVTVVLVTLPLFFCAWYFYFNCLDGMSYAGGMDIFLVKYDSAGNRIWSDQIGTAGNDYGGSIAFSDGHVYVSGMTSG